MRENEKMRLYHHKTDGGAEYLSDAFVDWEHNGESGREGVIHGEAKYVVRIDGDITATPSWLSTIRLPTPHRTCLTFCES